MRMALLLAALTVSAPAHSESIKKTVEGCLSCHILEDGRFDIVGVRALGFLPNEWALQFEDAFDRDGDGIAGRVQFVSGGGEPLIAKWGGNLAAARFEDFALIASKAHAIPIGSPEALDAIKAAFEARSPEPSSPFKE